MGVHPPRTQAPDEDQPCCDTLHAEIALNMSGENDHLAAASDLTEYQRDFKKRMGEAIARLTQEFGSVIEEGLSGIGTVSVTGSPEVIAEILRRANGKILRVHHRGRREQITQAEYSAG